MKFISENIFGTSTLLTLSAERPFDVTIHSVVFDVGLTGRAGWAMRIEINTDVSPHLLPGTNPEPVILLRFSMPEGTVYDEHPVGWPSEQRKLGIVHEISVERE